MFWKKKEEEMETEDFQIKIHWHVNFNELENKICFQMQANELNKIQFLPSHSCYSLSFLSFISFFHFCVQPIYPKTCLFTWKQPLYVILISKYLTVISFVSSILGNFSFFFKFKNNINYSALFTLLKLLK